MHIFKIICMAIVSMLVIINGIITVKVYKRNYRYKHNVLLIFLFSILLLVLQIVMNLLIS
jgi:hypothetical protein